jgi:predicted Zn-dependent protease with MMP-like domain
MSAVTSDPPSWGTLKAPSLADFEALAQGAYRRLPDTFRALCGNLVIQVEDFPSDEVIEDMELESDFDLLGLFHGVGLPFQSESAPVRMPNMIFIYRRPILDYWAEHEETLEAVVTHVLVHEIGHHFGLSDADMESIERGAD